METNNRPRPGRAADGAHAPPQRRRCQARSSLRRRQPGQYTSIDFNEVLDEHDVLGSIGSVGDAYDNAVAESFVDTFKTELISDRVRRTQTQLELAIVEWVAWFNNDRLHESLGDLPPTPAEFETPSTSSTADLFIS